MTFREVNPMISSVRRARPETPELSKDPAPPVRKPRRRLTAQGVERAASVALPLTLGAAVFAVAFDHVRATATWAGQGGWYALVIASTGEVMAVSAMIEIRARRRAGTKVKFPVFVLVSSIGWSGACNLRAAAGLTGDPGAWRYIAALWVVAAFALVSGMKSTRTHVPVADAPVVDSPVDAPVSEPSATVDAPVAEVAPVPAPVAVDVPVAAPEEAPTPAPKPSATTPRKITRKTSTARAGKRPTSKKAALTAYLDGVSAEDTRTDAELIRTYAPLVGLHENTARRYLASWRAAQADAAQADVPVAVAA
ncbi:hypothetical protein [Frankia sp. R43]|uniref:hypothetical protein n=1 Tax=Frankia sp. R43 TaxID=269536 RepID=UPI0006CA5D5A|nr:hypothetical protein [Frankia sp. R43]